MLPTNVYNMNPISGDRISNVNVLKNIGNTVIPTRIGFRNKYNLPVIFELI